MGQEAGGGEVKGLFSQHCHRWKSPVGPSGFTREAHSYIATAAKHDVDAFRAIAGLCRGDVWIPPATT